MHRSRTAWILSLSAIFFVISAGVSYADAEVSVLATTVSGDYGSDVDSDTQWLTLRYVAGRRIQVRAELSMIRADTLASGITFTGLGPTPNGGNGQGSMQQTATVSSLVAIGDSSSSTSGIGDLRFAVSTPLLGGGAKLLRVDGSLEVKIPTADEESNLGTGEWDYRLGVAGEYRFWSASVFGGLGWNALGDTALLELDDVLDAYVGLDSVPFSDGRLIATGWLEGWQPAIDTAGSRAAAGFGIRTTGKHRWRLQVRTGLTDSSEDLAIVAGMSFGISPTGPGVRGNER